MMLKGRIYSEAKCVLKFTYIPGKDIYWMDRNQKATLLLNNFKNDIISDLCLCHPLFCIDETFSISDLTKFSKSVEDYIKKYMEFDFPYVYSWRVDYPTWHVSSTVGVDEMVENADPSIKHETFIKLF